MATATGGAALTGGGGGGAGGRGVTTAAGGRDAATEAGVTNLGAAVSDGGFAGAVAGALAETIGAGVSGLAGMGAAGLATGRAGTWAASVFCRIARNTSPGREMFDKSIFVLISSSGRADREDFEELDDSSAFEWKYLRTSTASCSSIELECVFFSVTPTAVSASRMALLLTSNSRARSLIRILLIHPLALRISPKLSCRPRVRCQVSGVRPQENIHPETYKLGLEP